MNAGQNWRVSRRTWRAALVVFLTMLIAGGSASMAAALWAQQATVTTQATTGVWGVYVPGWSWAPTVTVQGSARGSNHDVTFAWTPPPNAGTVTYEAELVAASPGARVVNVLSMQGATAAFRIATPRNGAYTYRLTLVAVVNGARSSQVVRTLTLHADGSMQLG